MLHGHADFEGLTQAIAVPSSHCPILSYNLVSRNEAFALADQLKAGYPERYLFAGEVRPKRSFGLEDAKISVRFAPGDSDTLLLDNLVLDCDSLHPYPSARNLSPPSVSYSY